MKFPVSETDKMKFPVSETDKMKYPVPFLNPTK